MPIWLFIPVIAVITFALVDIVTASYGRFIGKNEGQYLSSGQMSEYQQREHRGHGPPTTRKNVAQKKLATTRKYTGVSVQPTAHSLRPAARSTAKRVLPVPSHDEYSVLPPERPRTVPRNVARTRAQGENRIARALPPPRTRGVSLSEWNDGQQHYDHVEYATPPRQYAVVPRQFDIQPSAAVRPKTSVPRRPARKERSGGKIRISDGNFGGLSRGRLNGIARSATDEKCHRYDSIIWRETGGDPKLFMLAKAVMIVESNCRPKAVNGTNRNGRQDYGLMQVQARTCNGDVGVNGDLRDPETNIRCGVKYLRILCDRYGHCDVASRLVAYNAGPGGAKRIRNKKGFEYTRLSDYAYRKLIENGHEQRMAGL